MAGIVPAGEARAQVVSGGWGAIPDEKLDMLRGGFVLPNGMDVAVGVDIETRVNGMLALRTTLNTTGDGGPIVSTGGVKALRPTGVERFSAFAVPGLGVIRIAHGASTPAAGDESPVAGLVANGSAVPTAMGSVRLEAGENGSAIVLQGDAFEIRHFVGRFTGSWVANTANDMTIDTVTTIDVDLRNSTVPVDTAILRWDAIATEVARQGIR